MSANTTFPIVVSRPRLDLIAIGPEARLLPQRLKAPLPSPFEAQGKLEVRGFHQ